MHYRMLVTTSMHEGATPEDTSGTVFDTLLHDETFCGEGGRFGFPLCDWFVIGGRWSGLLFEATIGDAYREAVIARFPDMAKQWWPESLLPEHQSTLDDLWHALGGTGPSPCSRDSLKCYPDDAAIITPAIYDALLSRYEGEASYHGHGCCEFIDLDGEPLGRSVIGAKWIVVVDYHN